MGVVCLGYSSGYWNFSVRLQPGVEARIPGSLESPIDSFGDGVSRGTLSFIEGFERPFKEVSEISFWAGSCVRSGSPASW